MSLLVLIRQLGDFHIEKFGCAISGSRSLSMNTLAHVSYRLQTLLCLLLQATVRLASK
jgi:hypothetical protein